MEPGHQGIGGRTENQTNSMVIGIGREMATEEVLMRDMVRERESSMEIGIGREMATGEEVVMRDMVREREASCKDTRGAKRLSSGSRRTEKSRGTRRRLETDLGGEGLQERSLWAASNGAESSNRC